MMNNLTRNELIRYSRHISIPEVGVEGQIKLKHSKALIIGVGGLGSPAALYLAAAGVGTLGLMDFDNVDESNLQRQIIYSSNNVGEPKLASAKKAIEKLNPHVKINLHNGKISAENAVETIKDYDAVIDGTDNLAAKYLINDACVLSAKPWVYGSIFRFEGRLSVFNYKNGPCYRCAFPEMPSRHLIPSCAAAGVLGVLPGVIGSMQAAEALKILLENGDILSGKMLMYNALQVKFETIKINKNEDCRMCGEKGKTTKLIESKNGQKCDAKNNGFNDFNESDEISADKLKRMIKNKENFVLVDVREKHEWDMCNIKMAKLVPLSRIMKGDLDALKGISKDEQIVLHCKSGGRSIAALEILKSKGYKKLKSLAGGIEEWAVKIENSIHTH